MDEFEDVQSIYKFPLGLFVGDNAEDAFIKALRVLMTSDEVTVRGSKTKELINAKFIINNPRERFFFLNGRKDNVPAKCAEFLWMLAGRNDIKWLSYYLPRAGDFSDNGCDWRGAYGPRLRNWAGDQRMIDQLCYIVDLLNRDPFSRQAVISIWNPDIDTRPGKDIPCNLSLQFLIRDGKLHMSITQRSCDIIWGYSGVDFFNWSSLMQLIAHWTNTKMGEMHHNIGSLHLYERHWKMAENILDNYHSMGMYAKAKAMGFDLAWGDGAAVSLEDLSACLVNAFNAANIAKATISYYDVWRDVCDPMLVSYTKAIAIYTYIQRAKAGDTKALEFLTDMIRYVSVTDMGLSIIEYTARWFPEVMDIVSVPSFAMEEFHHILQ